MNIDPKMRIVKSARELFHSRSYSEVGIQEICISAQVRKGSFYYFFTSKRELAAAVIDDMAFDWAHGLVAECFDRKVPPLERLDKIIDAAYYVQRVSKETEGRMRGCLFGNLALEVSTSDDLLREKLQAVFDSAKELFRVALDDAMSSGVLEQLDSERTAEAMLSYLEGIILLAKTRNEPEVVLTLGPAIKTLRIERKTNWFSACD